MTMIREPEGSDRDSPLDVIEQIVAANDWAFDRPNDQEIAIQIPGRWCDYNLYCAWNEMTDAMHLNVAFDVRVPPGQRRPIHDLLALVNDKVAMGHFALWRDEGLVVYRHVLPLRGCAGPTVGQVEDLLETAVDECERFYPAFQYVLWGGKTAVEAMAAAMIETVGEA